MDSTLGREGEDAARDPAPGDVLGRYRLERVLGSGGMGVVFAAHDPDLDRRVALKLLRADHDSGQARARLLREARAMARLTHPNVITVHEVGTVGGRDYVAMELVDGGTAAEWLREQPRSRADVLRVLCAAGRGLAAAHVAGLVHRDFKPHNVLLGRDGRVLVTDFGLVRGVDDLPAGDARAEPAVAAAAASVTGLEATVAPTPNTGSSTLTHTGAMLGTPAYMSPEQFAGAGTAASDQFALCVALWEGLAGERPFRGDSIDELRSAVEAGTLRGRDKIPRRLRGVLERGLARSPAARWPSVSVLLGAIDRADALPRRLAMGAGALVAAGAVTAAVVMLRGGSATAQASICPAADPMIATVRQKVAEIGARFGHLPQWPTIEKNLAEFFPRWRAAWDKMCAAPESPSFHGEMACLAGQLDWIAASADGALALPPEIVANLFAEESHITKHYIPELNECAHGARVGFPALPTDPALRERVMAVRRQLMALVVVGRTDVKDAERRAAVAIADARALERDYPAILAEALLSHGTLVHVAGDDAAAQKLYRDASLVAERAGHDPVRAKALAGELETMSNMTTDPAALDPLAERTRAALERAGDNPAVVDIMLANVDARRGDFDAAIARIGAARRSFEAAGDPGRIELTRRLEADYIRRRDAKNAGASPPAP